MLWTHTLDSFTAVGADVVSVFVHRGDEHGCKNSFFLERRLMRSEEHCLCSSGGTSDRQAGQSLAFTFDLTSLSHSAAALHRARG